MVDDARSCYSRVSTAACDTLGAPFGADVIRDCLRVLGSVGGNVVCADAREVEGLGVAVVLRYS